MRSNPRSLFLLGVVLLFAAPAAALEISPLSDRTLVVAIEVDRDGARVLGFTLKPRPFVAPPALDAPRAYQEPFPLQLEVALLGPAEPRYTRRVDLAGVCLAHPPATEPHVAGDTIQLHRESLLVELPELAGTGRVEIAYHRLESGALVRHRLGAGLLDRAAFRRAGGAVSYTDLLFAVADEPGAIAQPASSTALWPEDFDDDDIYQVFGSEAEADRRINVVIVPDGYTYAEKSVMQAHASDLVDYFRATRPFTEHDPFMNYALVYAYSTDSGTDECDCSVVVDSAMGTFFPLNNPSCGHSDNRCLYYGGGCDASGEANIAEAELRAPFKDTTIVMVNTGRYGGCGGARAVYSAGNSSATDIAVHELGHSLAGLADEYAGTPMCGFSAGEINTSRNQSNGAWPEWISSIGNPREGAEYYNQCVYRPLPNCEMRSLFQPFCPVCNQRWSLVTFGHPRVTATAPIESAAPSSPLAVEPWATVDFSVALRLSVGSATDAITWKLTKPQGAPAVVDSGTPTHAETFGKEGLHKVEVEVVADTNFVKPQKYGANRDSVLWNVNVAATAPPGEVSPPYSAIPLRFETKTRLTWQHPSASGAITFNVYSGNLSILGSGSWGTCLQPGLSNSQALILGQPASGTGKFYLVTGENSAGEGPLGQTSAGAPRVNSAPCP